jgi:hypothetical protein
MKIVSKKYLVLAVNLAVNLAVIETVTLSGCTTFNGDKRPEGVVIERNKQVQPAWVDSPSDRLLVNSTETRFHYSSVKQRDLAIAVNQSQGLAIAASYDLWLPGFNQRLGDFPQLKGLQSSPRTQKDMEALLVRVSHKIHTDVAKVEDIYYERIRIDNFENVPELQGVVEYFDVHTLVQLVSIDGDVLKQVLSDALLAAKFSEMKSVGKELARSSASKSK